MSTQTKLLVIEDDIGIQKQLRWAFDEFDVHIVDNREAATSFIKKHQPSIVTLDLGLPPDPDGASEGLATLTEILAISPLTKVIMVTGNHDRENAIRSINEGAFDFYEKPIDLDTLKITLDRACRVYELERDYQKLIKTSSMQSTLPGIIASSDIMLQVCRQVEKLAPVNVSTFLSGESGTGKELFARALHTLSDRKDGAFIAINCAAIPENLLESELFGHEKGAFTGATKRTIGKIEQANGGTLLLDEVGDIPVNIQVKLLRFIQERVIERIGGREQINVDVRIVSASHKNLEKLIESEHFREDLYYRIAEITINIPPLRERQGDIVAIARFILDNMNKQHSRKVSFSDDALHNMQSHDWPGNIRELENKLKRAFFLCEDNRITSADMELADRKTTSDNKDALSTIKYLTLKEAREAIECVTIKDALEKCDNNISKAAKLLDVSRPTLYDLISKFALDV